MIAKFNSQNMLIIFLSCFVSVWLQSLRKVLMWSTKIFIFRKGIKKPRISFYDTRIKFLPKTLFAYIIYFLLPLMVNTDETAEKNLFYKCVLDVSGLGGSILSKNVKILLHSLLRKNTVQKWNRVNRRLFFILLKCRLHLVVLEPAVRECKRNRAPQSNNLKSKSIFCNIGTYW